MRSGRVLTLWSAAVVVLQFVVPVAASADVSPVMMSQVIRPLECTVSVTTDGLHEHVQLMPEVCMRSVKARQFLAETRASFETK